MDIRSSVRMIAAMLATAGLLVGCNPPRSVTSVHADRHADQVPHSSASELASNLSLARQGHETPGRYAGRAALSTLSSLPDSGELSAADSTRTTFREGAYLWHPVRLSEVHAFASLPRGQMKLRTPDGRLLTLQYESHQEHPSGDWSWAGHVAGLPGQMSNVLITFGAKAVFGEIAQADASLPPLKLTTRKGTLWLGETTYEQMRAHPLGLSEDDAIPTPPPVIADTRIAAVDAKALPVKPTVDVMLGYTQGFMQAFGSHSATVTRLNNVVDDMNLVLSRSGVNGRVRLVHTVYVSYPDTDTPAGGPDKVSVALADLTGRDGHPVPASLQPLHGTLRDQYGADLVGLMVGPGQRRGCGVAWQTMTTNAAHESQFGFSAYAYGCEHTLKHELGHNMGLSHDRETVGGGSGPGVAPYAYGYRTRQPDGVGFCTTMAYQFDAGTPNAGVYSTPLRRFKGLPTGTANDDNARALAITFPVAAQFRASRISNATRSRNDVSGDGKSDLLFFNPGARRATHWRMDGASILLSQASLPVVAGDQLIGSGDANGDGRADLVWLTSSRQLRLWQSNGAQWVSTLLPSSTLVANAQPAAIADLTGDGRAELVFIDPTTRILNFWLLNGTSAPARHSGQFPYVAGDRLVASGDFNADGQQDLVWMSSARQLSLWWSNGQSIDRAVSRIGGPLGSGWSVVGAGDVDGDGRSDLLFHHPSPSRLSWWLMKGATVISTGVSGNVAAGTVPVATGDFNQDGRVDVVWRRNTSLWMWFSDGARLPGASSTVHTGLSTDWQVVNGGAGGG